MSMKVVTLEGSIRGNKGAAICRTIQFLILVVRFVVKCSNVWTVGTI